MKRLLSVFIVLFSLIPISNIYASPESPKDSGVGENTKVYSSDSGQVQVENVAGVIENNVSLAGYIPSTFKISGLYEIDTKERQCAYCWTFAGGLALFILLFGVYLGSYDVRDKRLYAVIPIVAIVMYFAHGIVHHILADDIFLQYYWMIYFDEMLFAYFYLKALGVGKPIVKTKQRFKARVS